MKTVIVIVEKTKTGYSAYLEDIDGIITTGKSLGEVKLNMHEAIECHLEVLNEYKKPIPESLDGEYTLKLKLDAESFFSWITKAMTQRGLSQISGMNETLISQYATGIKKPGQKQLKRIETALHQFANDLQSISF